MNTRAAQQAPAKASVAARPGAVRPAPATATPGAAPLEQPRRAVCACGGGCPRCAGGDANSGERPKPRSNPRPLHTDAAEREAERLAPRLLEARRNVDAVSESRATGFAANDHALLASTGTRDAGAGRPRTASARSPPNAGGGARAPPSGGPRARAPPTRVSAGRTLTTTNAPDRRLGGGRSLARAEVAGFGEALDFDLSVVRIHSGPYAAELAESRRAAAFTFGNHIILGREAAAAGRQQREAVLAHELIHVVQQCAPVAPLPQGHWAMARAPPVRPLQHTPLRPQNIDLVPDFIENGARAVGGAISDAGSAAYDGATYVGGAIYDGTSYVAGEVADFAVEVGGVVLEGAEAVIDYFAPGLLDFLRGDFLEDLGEMFCNGLDALVGMLLDPLSDIDIMSGLEATFTGIAQGVRGLYGALGAGARAAVGFVLSPFIWLIENFGDDIISAIQWLSDGVSGIFTALWDNIAAPVLDFLGSVGGAIWEGFKAIAGWVWGLCVSVKNAAEWAFDWLLDQFGLSWEGEDGVSAWIAEKAQAVWDAFLEVIEPIKTPLMVVGGILVLLSPLGPIVILSQVLPPLWEKISWLAANWQDLGVVVWARDLLHDDILPGIIGAVDFVKSSFASAAAWLASFVASVASGMADVVSAFGSNTCLNSVSRVLTHISDQFMRLQTWAESGFAGLSEAIGAFFDALSAIFQPILDFLIRFLIVAANPPMLPVAITAAIWLLLPDEFKPAVINFILDLLIGLSDLLAIALAAAGPMIFVLKAAVVGFMRHLRSGEGVTDTIKINASNKVANIMAGGGPQFIAGFAIGLLHGLIDGIIDPFKLLFMLFELVVTALKVLGRVLAPYVQELAPEAVTDGLNSFNDAMAVPPQTAPGANRPEATEAAPRAPPTEAGRVTSELTRGDATPAAGDTASAAQATPAANEAATSAEAGATTDARAGADAEAAEDRLFTEGGAADAEIIAGLAPRTIASVGGAEPEAISADALETSMREEVESEGSSVSGLASLLGGAWDFLMQQAGRLGSYLAGKLLEFLALGDYALGRKLGWLGGMILLEVLIAYFTAGGYTVIKEGASIGTRLLSYLLRFLDIGGEILGVLGRALAPLKGPLIRGFGAAKGFLSRFSFLRGIMRRIDNFIQTLFRFGDEAAAASSRAAPAPRAPNVASPRAPDARAPGAAPQATPRAAPRTPDAPTSRADAPAPTRAADSVDEAGERAARDVLDDPPTRPASEAAEELPDGTMRALDEPGVPRVRDDAAKLAQMAEARAAAITIAETNDAMDAPLPVTLGLLIALKRRYRWIDTFQAEPRAPGHFRIFMIASREEVDRDHTPGTGASFGPEGLTRHPRTPEPEIINVPSSRRGGRAEPELAGSPRTPATRGPLEELDAAQRAEFERLIDETGIDRHSREFQVLLERHGARDVLDAMQDTARTRRQMGGRQADTPAAADAAEELAENSARGSASSRAVTAGPAETHHIASQFSRNMREIFDHAFGGARTRVGGQPIRSIDHPINLIESFVEHRMFPGWYSSTGRYVMRGHHPDYHAWVGHHLLDALTRPGLSQQQAFRAFVETSQRLQRIIRNNPWIIQRGPRSLPPNLAHLWQGIL